MAIGREALIKALVEEMPWYVSAAVRFQIAVADQLEMPLADVHAVVTERLRRLVARGGPAGAPWQLAWRWRWTWRRRLTGSRLELMLETGDDPGPQPDSPVGRSCRSPAGLP
jgi:hypothetical protein